MNDKKRIAWCITGSGHYLKESIEIILTLKNVDLFLSKAGEEVLKWYDYSL
ncbi:MAG: flavoprotein, partial [Gammaproteobacteria bacterium]|nr:flavoprotein [Gammaproteobacteria bacterium]